MILVSLKATSSTCATSRQLRRLHDLAVVCNFLSSSRTLSFAANFPVIHNHERGRSANRPNPKQKWNLGQEASTPAENTAPQLIQIIRHRTLKMCRPATFILAAVAACATMSSEYTADAMALVPRRATPKPTGTGTKSSAADSSLVPSVPTTALFARPSQTSGNAQAMTSSSAAASSAPTKIDTSSFGRDADDIDSYRSQMLDLVYHRSMHRAGLE